MSDHNKSALEEKQLKRETRALWEESRAAAAAGDYQKLRALDHRIVEHAPGTESAESSTLELGRLKIDPWAIYAGLGATLLYLLAWTVSLLH